jgi:hypothetical protein
MRFFFVAAAAAFIVPSGVRAQDFIASNQLDMVQNWQMSSNIAAVNVLMNQRNLGGVDPNTGRSLTANGTPAAINSSAAKFMPSLARRKSNLTSFMNKSRKVDPAGAAKMEALFARADPIEGLRGPLATYGLRIDNVADAYATYWMQAWQAANGDTSDPSRATAQAVRTQSLRALSSTPEFSGASDATKQEFAEALLIQASMISASVDTYKNDPNMMRQLGAAVRKGAKASGLDLDAMTLTDEGFVPTRKTGAADPAPGTPEQALAANTAPVPVAENDTSPPYLLMAAAGGAGIGGVFLIGKMMGRRG